MPVEKNCGKEVFLLIKEHGKTTLDFQLGGGGGCMAHLRGTNETCLILFFDYKAS